MKILFYGGCHASALARVFRRYGRNATLVEHLTNFTLIRKKQPVPYDKISHFDWVVFSPIMNKAQWNTSHLEEFCRTKGVRYLKYPWLQWNGYFPGVARSNMPWYAGWIHGKLAQEAPGFTDFDTFREYVVHGDALASDAEENLRTTTRELRNREAAALIDFPIADFVEQKYRDRRLFLIPDHPSSELYKYLVPLMAERIGVSIDESFLLSDAQVQAGVQMPILPGVARSLKLNFGGTDFSHREFFGRSLFTLTEYLKLIYYRSDIRHLSALQRTYLRSFDGLDEEPNSSNSLPLPPRRRILVRKIAALPDGRRAQYEIYGEDDLPLALHRPFLHEADWEQVTPAAT
jgi:hypothetical protein